MYNRVTRKGMKSWIERNRDIMSRGSREIEDSGNKTLNTSLKNSGGGLSTNKKNYFFGKISKKNRAQSNQNKKRMNIGSMSTQLAST